MFDGGTQGLATVPGVVNETVGADQGESTVPPGPHCVRTLASYGVFGERPAMKANVVGALTK